LNKKQALVIAGAILSVLVLSAGCISGIGPQKQQGKKLVVKPDKLKVTYANGVTKTYDPSSLKPQMIVNSGGGGATSVSQSFTVGASVYRGSTLMSINVNVNYTIRAYVDGSLLKSISGSMKFASGSSQSTTSLSVSQSEVKNAAGTGSHTVKFSCVAKGTAEPEPGITVSAKGSGSQSYSIQVYTYSMNLKVS